MNRKKFILNRFNCIYQACHQNLHRLLLGHILWKMVAPNMQIPVKVVLNNLLQTAR